MSPMITPPCASFNAFCRCPLNKLQSHRILHSSSDCQVRIYEALNIRISKDEKEQIIKSCATGLTKMLGLAAEGSDPLEGMDLCPVSDPAMARAAPLACPSLPLPSPRLRHVAAPSQAGHRRRRHPPWAPPGVSGAA